MCVVCAVCVPKQCEMKDFVLELRFCCDTSFRPLGVCKVREIDIWKISSQSHIKLLFLLSFILFQFSLCAAAAALWPDPEWILYRREWQCTLFFLLIHLMHELAGGCELFFAKLVQLQWKLQLDQLISACSGKSCGTSRPARGLNFVAFSYFLTQMHCLFSFSALFSSSLPFRFLPRPPFPFPAQYNIHFFASHLFSPCNVVFFYSYCFLVFHTVLRPQHWAFSADLLACFVLFSPVFLSLIYFMSLVFSSLSSLQLPMHIIHTPHISGSCFFFLSDSFRNITPLLFKS